MRTQLWLNLATDATRLFFEAQGVIGLRLAGASRGDLEAGAEAWLMCVEKGQAAWDAQCVVLTSLAAGEGHLAPARAIELYRRRIRANHRRLTKRTRAATAGSNEHENL